MFKEASIFRKFSDEASGYYGPIISDFASTTRAHELRVAGFLTLLHLCWTGLLRLRISPCVVLATFLNDGLAGICSPDFLENVLPETASRLKLWDDHVASSPLFTSKSEHCDAAEPYYQPPGSPGMVIYSGFESCY
jgi:hypothetical protein